MQTEVQKPLETAAQADSNESKRGRGGKRPGAGRKPNLAKRIAARMKPATAADVLAGVDVEAVAAEILKRGSLPLKFQMIIALWDRVYGKPKQDLSISGGVTHTHVRDPLLVRCLRKP